MTPRVAVSGVVNLNGEPLNEPNATISFALAGEAPSILEIKEGKFHGQAPVGNLRVEIRALYYGDPTIMDGKPVEGSGLYNFIPEQFNDRSTLTATVTPNGSEELIFNVETGK